MLKRSVLFLVLLLSMGLVPLINAQTDIVAVPTTEYADFLRDYYDIVLTEDVDQQQFNEAVALIVGDVETPAELDLDGFTELEAILTSLYYVNFDELAFTYPEEKVDEALNTLQSLPSDLPLVRRQELAAALDTGLLDPTANLSAEVSLDFANDLLGRILELTGHYKNFLGYSSDPDIYSRLIYTWNSFDQVLLPELQAPANELIREGVITGYNVKRLSQNAEFDPALSIVYGHANIDHVRQLIGLLRSEGIVARVLLEPKTSAFLHLAEWGEPTSSPEYQVEALDDGNYIAYAKEFDLALEFNSEADRERFDAIIKAYAKKDASGEPGLILGSWWQPLYSSRTLLADYVEVVNNVVFEDQFYLQSFSLVEDSPAIVSSFESAYPEADVEVWDLWVNEAFHNYLLGEAT